MTGSIAETWLQHARDDLKSAEVLLEAKIYAMVCFHAQQAVEKGLKALLAAASLPIPRIHNLIRLRRMVEDSLDDQLQIDQEALMFLNDIYLDSRYPTDFGVLPAGIPDSKDAKRAYYDALGIFRVIELTIETMTK
jgi:HEPN domain-containing protein